MVSDSFFKVKENIIYQDNQSAMKMEKNGRRSCTGNSQDVSIRSFVLKDRVDKGALQNVFLQRPPNKINK